MSLSRPASPKRVRSKREQPGVQIPSCERGQLRRRFIINNRITAPVIAHEDLRLIRVEQDSGNGGGASNAAVCAGDVPKSSANSATVTSVLATRHPWVPFQSAS
jgi:hypothetical protein